MVSWHIDPADHSEITKHIEFVRWMKRAGADVKLTKLAVYAHDFRGLHASTDIAEGEEIRSLPTSLRITRPLLAQTELGKLLNEKLILSDYWQAFYYPLIFIMENRNNPKSDYKPFLDVIPSQASDNPSLFSEEEKKWLLGSPLLRSL
jgi:hypothetical protein